MDVYALWNSQMFSLVVIPILIFFARILDVSIGTLRIAYVSRGMKHAAPLLGFFEVLIWILAIGQIMANLTHWVNYVAYAAGFATGNYVGILLEQRLAMGIVSVRIITKKDATELRSFLKREKYGYTSFAAYGVSGKIRYLLTVVRRSEVPHLVEVVRRYNPHAFVAIEDVRSVSGDEVFDIPPMKKPNILTFHNLRKGK